MSDKILEELKQSSQEAVTALREAKEKYGAGSAEFKTAMDRTEAQLKKFDEANAALVTKIEEEKTKREANEEKFREIELALARGIGGTDKKAYKNGEEYKSFMDYVRKGVVNDYAKKTLRMDASQDGGYLVPVEFANEIIKNVTEISPIRQISRVRSVGKKTVEIPKRTSIPTAAFEGEEEENPQNNSQYGNETLHCHRLGVEIVITRDLMMDSAFDMEAEVSGDVAESFANREGFNFVNGNGVKRPEGFLAKASLQAAARDTAGSGVLSADDLLLLTGDLKEGYSPYFVFNRQTLAYIRTLKGTTNDHYLWQMGLAPDKPSTIGGDPYIVAQDMPSIAAGAFSVAYGDFRKGYMITDRTGLMVIRDDVTGARSAVVKYNFMKWLHGQVVLDEAFKLLRVKP